MPGSAVKPCRQVGIISIFEFKRPKARAAAYSQPDLANFGYSLNLNKTSAILAIMNDQPEFVFHAEMVPRHPALSASLPMHIASKPALLTALADQLSFPDYFGGNWDALEECMRDLSWLPPGPVVLVHTDLPLANDIVNLRMYLAILRGAVQKLSMSQDHPLTVIFPPGCRETIVWLLRSQRAQEKK